MLLHVFRHVHAGDGGLVVEQEVGQGLGQLGLAHARGAEEEEAAERRFGSFRPARARRTASDTASSASS